MILTAMQVGAYTRELICHPHSWASQIFGKHHRVLAGLETADNHIDLSGDGIPQISCDLVSDAMQDIRIETKVYSPKPAARVTANTTEEVVSKCHQGVLSNAQPDAHNTIDQSYPMWELLTGSGGELMPGSVRMLQPNFTAPIRHAIIPRSFTAAVATGELMNLTSMQAAHDKVDNTLRERIHDIDACDRWIDGERYENCSVIRDIVENSGFGYRGPNSPVQVIDYMVRECLAYSDKSIQRHLEMLLKESTDLSLIVKKIVWGNPLTRHQLIVLMFYDLDFLMKTVNIVLKQNKYNQTHQPGYFEEARHRVAIAIEYVGAPMQMVLPTCETTVKVYDSASFWEI